jgi:glycosyltransferase involved in cell wall biosynthesis
MISAIMPVYDAACTIRDSIQSIQAQTVTDW